MYIPYSIFSAAAAIGARANAKAKAFTLRLECGDFFGVEAAPKGATSASELMTECVTCCLRFVGATLTVALVSDGERSKAREEYDACEGNAH